LEGSCTGAAGRSCGRLGPNSLCDWQLALEVFGGIKEALPAASQRQPGEVLEFVLGAIRAADAKVVEG
jgi:hypothetical protein